jgi:hypothetical protein
MDVFAPFGDTTTRTYCARTVAAIKFRMRTRLALLQMATRRLSLRAGTHRSRIGEDRIHASCPGTLAEQMRNTRPFVKSRLRDLRAPFSAEAVTIRAEIAKHVQKIVLTPEGRAYVALVLEPALVAAWMVPGPGMHHARHRIPNLLRGLSVVVSVNEPCCLVSQGFLAPRNHSEGIIRPSGQKWPSHPELDWARMGSSRRLARAVWARCFVRGTVG